VTHTDACNLVIFEIQAHGGRAWRREVGLFYDLRGNPRKLGSTGQADVYGIVRDGRHIEVEVKTGRGQRTSEQKQWEATVRELGAIYCLARFTAGHDGRVDVRQAIEGATDGGR